MARPFRRNTDCFLRRAKGVIHVGANVGQEKDLYAARGLNVLWIEPIPEIFDRLATLIAPYAKQKALNYLVTDVDGREYSFHVSSNGGASSSILDLALHKELWPEVKYTKTIAIRSATLTSVVRKERLNMADYDALVLDTQGSELLVLQGAAGLLPYIRYIEAEAADFEAYAGCCRLVQMDGFLREHGFRRMLTKRVAHKTGVGTYYELVYERSRVLRGESQKAA